METIKRAADGAAVVSVEDALRMRLMMIHCVNSDCLSMMKRVPAITPEEQQLKNSLTAKIREIANYTAEHSPIFSVSEGGA